MGESQPIQSTPIINSIVGNLGQFINLNLMKEAGQRYPRAGKAIKMVHDGIEAINSISNQQNMLAQGYQMNQFTGQIQPINPVQQQPVQQQEPQYVTKKAFYNFKNEMMAEIKKLAPPPAT